MTPSLYCYLDKWGPCFLFARPFPVLVQASGFPSKAQTKQAITSLLACDLSPLLSIRLKVWDSSPFFQLPGQRQTQWSRT